MLRVAVAAAAALTLAACATAPSAPKLDQEMAQRAHKQAVQEVERLFGKAVEEKSITDLQAEMSSGRLSSETITSAYLQRIQNVDRPTWRTGLNSVLAVSPDALNEARRLDAERAAGRVRGPLHGVPVLIKDNIETRELPTTAGSLALAANATGRDAPLVARLREAGAVILGKTNLSEWANIRSGESISGWSAVGGQTRNPYALDRNTCGSSSGSGAAAAASLAAVTVGTETDGSVVCPAAMNGVVGLKPTVGLVSRARVVPISNSQDTPGPMARSVRDAALLLTAMAGSDPADPATVEADRRKRDYAAGLDGATLRGRRVGVLRAWAGFDPQVDAVLTQAIADLKAGGAEVVEIADFKAPEGLGEVEFAVLLAELKTDLAAYLKDAPAAVPIRTLADAIAFNRANADAEMRLFGQDVFEQAEATPGATGAAYEEARAKSRRLAREALDGLFRQHRVEALIGPSYGVPWLIDPVHGDQYSGGSSSQMPAVSGYPHLTVPMGLVKGLPVGLSFVGPAWSEAELLSLGHAYEQRTRRRAPPRYLRSVDEVPEVAAALAPAAR